MRDRTVTHVARVLHEALEELLLRPHAFTVEEITGLLALAHAFRMPYTADALAEQLRIAQSTVSG